MKWVKAVLVAFLCFVIYFFLVAKANDECLFGWHIPYGEAKCTEDKKCLLCSYVFEHAKGHTPNRPDAPKCDENVICSVCGMSITPEKEHIYLDATCTKPKTCMACGKESGKPIEHNYVNGTCTLCGDITYGIWGESYYVDKYGDKTDQDYIYAYASGKFSNSAITNRELEIKWLFDKNGAKIQLYEYGDMLVKGYLNRTEYYVVFAKNEGGEIELSASLEQGEDRLRISNTKKLYNLLSHGGVTKFVIYEKENRNNQYWFSIDADGFKNMWDKHWVWK